MLVVSCLVYLVFGALIFQRLEGRHLIEQKANHTQRIVHDSALYRDTVWRVIQENPWLIHEPDRAAAIREIIERARPEFEQFVQTTFTGLRFVVGWLVGGGVRGLKQNGQ